MRSCALSCSLLFLVLHLVLLPTLTYTRKVCGPEKGAERGRERSGDRNEVVNIIFSFFHRACGVVRRRAEQQSAESIPTLRSAILPWLKRGLLLHSHHLFIYETLRVFKKRWRHKQQQQQPKPD